MASTAHPVPDVISNPSAAIHGATQKNGVRAGEPISGLTYHSAGAWWQILDLPEIWSHRELLWMLGQRDLRVRYRQTMIGIAWCVLQPLVSMVIFATLFGLLGRSPAADGVPYPLVVLAGLVPWQIFAAIVTQAGASLVAQQAMIGKVYFPRLLLPLAVVIPNLADLAVSVGLILAGLVAWGVRPSWHLLALPLAAAYLILAALAVGIGVAALNARYRDATVLVSFALQIGFFVSPVVYDAGVLIPPRWRWLYGLNPMAAGIDLFRWCVLPDRPFPGASLGLATIIVVGLLGASLACFRTIEKTVTDSI